MPLVNGQYRVPAFLIQKLTDTGFETGGANTNFNADYSVTPQDAFFTAPPGLIVEIIQVQISITDTGAFASTDYGNIVGGLTNGILTVVEFNGVQFSNADATINTNSEIFTVTSLASIIEYGSNQRTLLARFDLATPLVLNGDTADKFILRLSDDMTGLEIHEFVVFGGR